MSEAERIWDLLQRSFEGNDAWRCPSMRDLLGSLSAQQAAAKPVPNAPSAWEIVLHTTVSERVVLRRLRGEAVEHLPDSEAWPVPAERTPQAWLDAKLAFGEARRALRQAVAGLSDEQLRSTVPGREYTHYVMLHGVVEHTLYHAGQIEVLVLAQGLHPASSPMASHEAG
jgi:uncharacterized damage-inducible protein DinB